MMCEDSASLVRALKRCASHATGCMAVVWALLAQLASIARPGGLAAQAPANDSAKVHGALRQRIAAFEGVWYRTWETAQFERNGGISLLNRGTGDRQRDRRRFTALSCYWRTPTMRLGRFATVAQQWVTGPVDRGAVCPIWFPPDDDVPPDESEDIDVALNAVDSRPVRMARDELLTELAKRAEQHPTDSWITGQRVRFLIDQRRFAEARSVAEACQGDARDCLDLRALTRYVVGELTGADALFREREAIADTTRPAGASCLPDGVIALFDEVRAKQVNDYDCRDQQRLAATLFFLADPLFGLPGNERYVAHHVRRVQVALRALDDRDERYVWNRYAGGDGMRHTVLRYGWPSHTFWPGWRFEWLSGRQMEASPTMETFMRDPVPSERAGTGRSLPRISLNPIRHFVVPQTVKEYYPDRTALVPAFAALQDPYALVPSHFSLTNPDPKNPDGWWPHEHMLLQSTLRPMPAGQDVVLRRDSANRFVLAIEDPLRTHVSTTAKLQAALIGGQSEGTLRLIAERDVGLGDVLRLDGAISGDPLVVSAEVYLRAQPLSALRLRYGVRPPSTLEALPADSVALSPPVFLQLPRGSTELPMDAEAALGAMAGTLTFSREVPLAFYWESYGFTPGDTLQVTVTMRRDDDRSVARAAGAALGLVGALRDSISVRWTEPDGRHVTVVPGTRMIVGRALSLEVSELPPGAYVLSIQLEHAVKGTARSSRRFTLR